MLQPHSPCRFSIGRRVTAIIGVVLLLALTGSAIGVWSLYKVAAETQHLVEQSVVTERLVADWYRNVLVSIKRTTAVAVSADPALADFFAGEQAASTKSTTELQEKIEKLISNGEERAVFEEIVAARKAYAGVRDKVIALKKAGDTAAARQLLDEGFVPGGARYGSAVQKMADLQRAQIDRAGADIQADNRRAQIALVAFSGVAVMLGSVLGVWLVRGITRPLRRAAAVAQRIAQLDLTDDIRGDDRDETGQLMQSLATMQGALRTLAAQIRVTTDSIGTASAEIADGNADLSTRTEQAASSLQQTAASIEQMNGTVQQSALSARTADGLAGNAAQVAERGGIVVAEVISTMDEINGSSKRIADIISVIDGIAFQTNILALNAAVEAARAGEQGRGFAVVAGEVRLLAQRSADAAKEIKTLIGASVDRVDAGARLVADAGRTMTEIVDSVKRVSQIIGEISNAAAEQSQGIGQVAQAVTQLDQVTQQNAALVEQSAAAAESLKSQSVQLAENVQRFALPR